MFIFIFLINLVGFKFLDIPESPAVISLFNVDGFPFFKNPAFLSDNQKYFSFMTNFWLIDSKIFSIAFKTQKNLGFGVNYYDFGKFEYHDEYPDDFQKFYFRPYAFKFDVIFAKQIDPEVKIGLSFKSFYRRIHYYKEFKFAGDIGVIYLPKKLSSFSFAFLVDNIGIRDNYPFNLHLGFCFDLKKWGKIFYEFKRPLLDEDLDYSKFFGYNIIHILGYRGSYKNFGFWFDYKYSDVSDKLGIGFDINLGKVILIFGWRYQSYSFDQSLFVGGRINIY